MSVEKSSFLILGGCGFIGRNLVHYLIENELAYKIRVADKVSPQLAYLNKLHEAAFENPIVEFVSANLLNKGSLEKVFRNDELFDYVVNCAGETRYGLTDAIYHEGIVNLTASCAKLAAQHKVKRFVEISCGRMASNAKEAHKENHPTDPWTQIASCKLKAEDALKKVASGLNYTILRPAIVYGVGDKTGIVPRLVMAAVYRHSRETMKFLWNRNIMMNTVHVHDLCRAIRYTIGKDEMSGQTYNVVDAGCTTQGIINDLISEIFDVNVHYVDSVISMLCKIDFDALAEDINDKHSSPWAELCQKYSITSTPLSSYLHKEDLYNKHLRLDGAKLRELGFELMYPEIKKDSLLKIIDDYTERNLFPKFEIYRM